MDGVIIIRITMKKYLKANLTSLQNKSISSESLNKSFRIKPRKLFSTRGGDKYLRISQRLKICTDKGGGIQVLPYYVTAHQIAKKTI